LARYAVATVSPVLSSGRNRGADGAAGGENGIFVRWAGSSAACCCV